MTYLLNEADTNISPLISFKIYGKKKANVMSYKELKRSFGAFVTQ